MNTEIQNQDNPQSTLRDIKQMMERSSRFISLSGFSGIAAGLCALAGAHFANQMLTTTPRYSDGEVHKPEYVFEYFRDPLSLLAIATFITAFVLAFIFTYFRSQKTGTPIWGTTAKRLMFNVAVPLFVGGCFIIKLLDIGAFGLIAPGCLIFYGLALLNGSKYTLGEIKYLGYAQLILGLANLFFIGYGIYFWAIGFGIMHIVYGIVMWYKYERGN